MNLVSFHVRGQWLGCDIEHVKETLVVRPLTRVFLVPPWLAGIISLRGDVVAVLDLGRFLGMAPIAPHEDCRIVIVQNDRKGGAEQVAGLLVDRLAEVTTADPAALAPPPATLAPDVAALLAGVVTLEHGAPLAVLDVAKLFASERLAELGKT